MTATGYQREHVARAQEELERIITVLERVSGALAQALASAEEIFAAAPPPAEDAAGAVPRVGGDFGYHRVHGPNTPLPLSSHVCYRCWGLRRRRPRTNGDDQLPAAAPPDDRAKVIFAVGETDVTGLGMELCAAHAREFAAIAQCYRLGGGTVTVLGQSGEVTMT